MSFGGLSEGICDFSGCKVLLVFSSLLAILSCFAVLILLWIVYRDGKLFKDNSIKIITWSVSVVFIKCLLEFIISLDFRRLVQNSIAMGLVIGLAYGSFFWNMLLGQLVNYVINHQLFVLSHKVSFRSYDNKIEKQTKLYIIYGIIVTILCCIWWVVAQYFYIQSGDEDIVITVLQVNIPVVIGILYLAYIMYHFHDVGKRVEVVTTKIQSRNSKKVKRTKRTTKDMAKQQELIRTCVILFIYPVYFIICQLLVDIPVIISASAPNTQLSQHFGYLSSLYMALRIPYHAQGIVDLILFLKLPVVAKRLKLGKYNKSDSKKKMEASEDLEVTREVNLKQNNITDDFMEDNLQTIELKENSIHSSRTSIQAKLIPESKEEGVKKEEEDDDDDEEEEEEEDILGSVDNIDMEDITTLDESESFENPVVSRPHSTSNEV